MAILTKIGQSRIIMHGAIMGVVGAVITDYHAYTAGGKDAVITDYHAYTAGGKDAVFEWSLALKRYAMAGVGGAIAASALQGAA